MDIKWAFLVPSFMIVLYLALGYAFEGPQGLRAHYLAETNNIVPILALAVLYILGISIWLKLSAERPKVVTVRTVRMK